MKQGFLAWGMALAVLSALAGGCNLFSPQSSKETIEVSFNMPGSSCTLQANLDGGSSVNVGPGSVYTFPAVSAGSHTVNLTSGSAGTCGSTPCEFSGGLNYSTTFQGNAGQLEVVEVSQGSNCYNMVVTAP